MSDTTAKVVLETTATFRMFDNGQLLIFGNPYQGDDPSMVKLNATEVILLREFLRRVDTLPQEEKNK